MAKLDRETIDRFALRIGKSESTVRRLIKRKKVGTTGSKNSMINLKSVVTQRYLDALKPKDDAPVIEAAPGLAPMPQAEHGDIAELKKAFAEYVKTQKFPALEAFAANKNIAIEQLFHPELDELLSQQRTKMLAGYQLMLLNGKIKRGEYRTLVEREESRPIARSPRRMYEMMVENNWLGPQPSREELFAIVDHEKKLGSPSAEKISKAQGAEKKSSDPPEKLLEFPNFRLRFSRAQFAIFASLSYQAVQQALAEGRLEENDGGILVNSPLSEEFLSRLGSNSQTEKTRETVRRLKLDNEIKELQIEKERRNLVSAKLAEELYTSFMSRFAGEMLNLGPGIEDHIAAKIKTGLSIEQTPKQIAQTISALIIEAVQVQIKIIKTAQRKLLAENAQKPEEGEKS